MTLPMISKARDKVMKLSTAVSIVADARRQGFCVVTTNGCFDLLHVGHVRNLQAAKALGDILVVGVNSDHSVRQNKGKTRPIVPARERAEVIASLVCVDAVFIFHSRDPRAWLKRVKPHIHVKGADYLNKPMIERKIVEQCGGKIVFLPVYKGKSTTALIERIKQCG